MKISFFQYISQSQRLILYNLIADLLDDGVPLYDAISLICNDDGERVYGRSFIKKLSIIMDKMKSSSSVTDVLAGLVPPQDLTVLNAAERSGQLAQGLRMIISMVEKNNELVSKLRQSLISPVMLFIIVLLVIMGYSLQVFPTFLGVLPLKNWPAVTQSLYGFGVYLSNGGFITILVVSAIVITLIRLSMPFLSGAIRSRFIDKIPPYNYYRVIQLGVFLRMLSTLMLNNVPMVDAFNLMKERASPFMTYHLNAFTQNMKSGRSYKESLDTGFLTNEMLLTVNVYAGMDSFSETVKKMAEKCDIKIKNDIETLSGILKNLSLVTLSVSVVWIFGAIFSLVDKLGSGV